MDSPSFNLSYEVFCQRVLELKASIVSACAEAGRDPASVELLPVTKNHPAQAAAYAAKLGLRAVGENRVQEAAAKREGFTHPELAWELIGHLQSNKAKLAVRHFDRIQSLDSAKLAQALEKAASAEGRKLRVLLQVNAGRDPAKFGAELEEAPALLEAVLACPSLEIEGLMTIAPLSDSPAQARACFAALRALRDRLRSSSGLALATLSMGMSGDLREAILEGSTQVRVGTALFGTRKPLA